MKAVRNNKKSIYRELAKLLLISFLISATAFTAMNIGVEYAIIEHFENATYVDNKVEEKISSLKKFVKKNGVASDDKAVLDKWMRTNHIMSLQIFKDNKLQYDSEYETEGQEWEVSPDDYYGWEEYNTVRFEDGDADVFTLGVSTSRYYIYAMIVELVIAGFLFLLVFMLGIQKTMKYIWVLSQEVEILEGGNLDYPITVQGNDELSELARGLEQMRSSFKEQMEQEAFLTQSHNKLVTEMSHDLRTPLTSLLMYTEILKKKKYGNEIQKEKYIDKIDDKAYQIKRMIDNIFEYSLVNSNEEVELEYPQKLQTVFYDILSEVAGYLKTRGFDVICDFNWNEDKISIKSDYIIRIMDNITSNILKYADPNDAVRIATCTMEGMSGISVENNVAEMPQCGESTNIGIRNIENMVEVMDGKCNIINNDGGYKIEILFFTE
ncbi:MAG: HAMP domain-containing histidine kinase [Clostridiales bacterium]|nr:HAMP domain-containing histidine kinase [Clostridiales bacterium]